MTESKSRKRIQLFIWFSLCLPSVSLGEEGGRFLIRPGQSMFTVKVGRAGFLKVFGHDHLIEVRRYGGEVNWIPEAIETSSVQLEIDAASLTVVDKNVKGKDKAKIQADMETKVLEIEKYPDIRFDSKGLRLKESKDGEYRCTVSGDLTLHGVTRKIEFPLRITVANGTLHARGNIKLEGSHFGIERVSVAGGTVRTKDTLELSFDLVATRK